jgi:hypothetical protein
MSHAVRSIEEDTQQMSSLAKDDLIARTPQFRESTEQLLRPPAGSSYTKERVYDLPPSASGSLTSPRQSPYTTVVRQVLKEMRILLRRPLSLRGYRLRIPTRAPSVHYPTFQHLQSISLCLRLDNKPGFTQSAHSSNSNLNLPLQSMNSLVSANDDRPGFGDVEEFDQTEHQQHTQGRPWIQGRESDYTLPVMTSPNDLRQPTATQPQMTMPTNIGQKAFESPPLNDARHGSSSSFKHTFT